MQEAFLLQMNEFDRFLETHLRRLLDPVVAAHPPARERRQNALEPIRAAEPPDLVPAVEAVPLTVQVAPLPQL